MRRCLRVGSIGYHLARIFAYHLARLHLHTGIASNNFLIAQDGGRTNEQEETQWLSAM